MWQNSAELYSFLSDAPLHNVTTPSIIQATDVIVYIGRFEPFHLAHLETVNIALSHAAKLIMVIGSAQDERSIKNPFSASERQAMVMASLLPDQRKRVEFLPIIDLYNDVKWVAAVKAGIDALTQPSDRIALIGHFKDDSSYYLRMFQDWQLIELKSLKQAISATPIRERFFEGVIESEKLPVAVTQFLKEFQTTPTYAKLVKKYQQHDFSVI